MKLSRKFASALAATLFLVLFAVGSQAKVEADVKAVISEVEALALGTEAYVYAYPLVTMEYTRRVMTNVAAPEGTRAPMGQLIKAREYPDATFRDVTAPNADTLYTTAWVDVTKEPWILSIPDMQDRYFLFPMLDGFTNVFQVPGKRTTGTGAQTYAITGPGWSGTLPAGVTEYKSPTGIVWILGRIYCTGTPEDYKAVHALQDQVSIVPLSAYGKSYTPAPGTVNSSVDMKTAVRAQVNALDAASYFKLFAELLKPTPLRPKMHRWWPNSPKSVWFPGRTLMRRNSTPPLPKALQPLPKPAQDLIMGWLKGGLLTGDMKLENGWVFTTKTGLYGTSYLQRALVTAIGLGANRPQDAIYPTSEGPDIIKKYSGAKKYVMHFEKDKLPPVNGFWSITMYDADYFFVDNPLNRYTVSERNDLKANADGSIDIYIQNESPGKDKESNWLPAPNDQFILMMRTYWPKDKAPSIIDGSWKIPAVKEAS